MSDEECDAFTAQITSRQGQLTDSVLGNRKRELERVLALVKARSDARITTPFLDSMRHGYT